MGIHANKGTRDGRWGRPALANRHGSSSEGFARHGITSEGVIDDGYTGPIKVKLYNHSDAPYHVLRGDKITQLVIMPCAYVCFDFVDELEDSERGDNGFGSTGK